MSTSSAERAARRILVEARAELAYPNVARVFTDPRQDDEAKVRWLAAIIREALLGDPEHPLRGTLTHVKWDSAQPKGKGKQ